MADELSENGMATALAKAQRAARPLPVGEQQDLPLPGLPLGDPAERAGQPARSGPQGGRPKGSANKSTEAWSRYLLARYSSPLEVAASLASRPLKDLRADLVAAGFSVADDQGLELLKIQLRAAEALAPYVHQRQPMAIQGEGSAFVLALGRIDAPDTANDGLIIDLPEFEENQGVTDDAPGEVERSKSNGSSQAIDPSDETAPDPLIADQPAPGQEGDR